MAAPPAAMRQFAAAIADLRRRLDRVERGQRTTQLDHSSIEDAGLPIRDSQQQVRQIVGRQVDGTFAVTHHHGDPPPQPAAPVVYARELALVVSHDGGFADAAAPADLARFDVHIADLNIQGLAPSLDTLYGSIPAGGGTVCATVDNQPHYVQVVAVSASGQRSAASEVVEAAPRAASNVEFGVVGAEQLQSVLNLASRIVAGDPNGSRVELNGQGFSAYDAEGNSTVAIDSNTGNTVITGELRTANSGRRIVWNQANDIGDAGQIRFVISDDETQEVTFRVLSLSGQPIFSIQSSPPSNGQIPTISFPYNPSTDSTDAYLGGVDASGRGRTGIGPLFGTYRVQALTDYEAPDGTWFGVMDLCDQRSGSSSFFESRKRVGTAEYHAGVSIKDSVSTIGGGTGVYTRIYGYPYLEVVNQQSTAYGPVQASNLAAPSTRAAKKNIRPPRSSPLDAVRQAPADEFHYHGEGDDWHVHVGPMAEDLPVWLSYEMPVVPAPDKLRDGDPEPGPPQMGQGVDLNALVGALWEALRELDEEIDELRDAARPRITKPHRKARDE